MYLEVSSKEKNGQRLLCCRDCVTRGVFYRQARVHIHNFTKVNLRVFVAESLVQSLLTPGWELPLCHIDIIFSDSRDPIFIFRDPDLVPKTP